MAIVKKAAAAATTKTPAKAVSKAVTKAAPADPIADDVSFEPITLQRTYVEGTGERNDDPSETLDHVPFPLGAKVIKVAVMIGTSEDYGAAKASVTVSVPSLLEEADDAFLFASEKAKEYLDAIAGTVAVEEEAPVTKKGATSKRSAGKAAVEPDEPDEEETEEAGEEPDLFDEDELGAMEETQLKELCETWEIPWPTAKKANVRKAEAVSAIIEKQNEYTEAAEDGEDAADADEGIGPEDIQAMDRKQVEAFIVEYNNDCEDGEELEVDMSDYPKNTKGLTKLKTDLIDTLFEEATA